MSPRSERQTILRNVLSSYGVRALLVLSVLLVTPYLFRALGPGGFGTWSVMLTVATVFSLLEIGFSATITKRVAQLRGAGRLDEIGATVRAGAALMAGLGLVGLAVSLAVAAFGEALAAPADRDDFRAGLAVLGVALLVRLPLVAYGSALVGWQRYDLFSVAEGVSVLGAGLGAVVAIETGGGIFELACVQAGALLAGGVLFGLLLRRVAPGLRLLPSAADRRGQRGLAAFGSYTLLADSMTFVAERMDTVIVAAIRGAAAAGPYAAATKLRSGLQSLTLPLFNLLLPMVAELRARGESEELVRRFVLATRVAVQVSLPVAAALALFAGDLVGAWLGSGAPESTAAIVAVLMAVEVLALSATPAHHVLVGSGGVRLVGAFGVGDAVLNVGLSIVLVSAYGAIGAALGTLFTSSLLGLVKIPLAGRAIGCTAHRLLADGIVPALLASIPAVAVMVAVRLLLEEGVERLAVGAMVGVGLALVLGGRQLGWGRLVASLRPAQ